MLPARQRDNTNGINMYASVTDVQNWGKANLKFVQSANSIMEQAREITTERAVQTIGADIIETLIDTLDICLCAHVQKRPLQGEFKSLPEIAGQFWGDFRTACLRARVKFTDEPPKAWILPAHRRCSDGREHTRVKGHGVVQGQAHAEPDRSPLQDA